MTRERKFLKNLLASISITLIIINSNNITHGSGIVAPNGIMMIGNATLADTNQNYYYNNWKQIDQLGNAINIYVNAPQHKALTYGGNFYLEANVYGADIIAINLSDKASLLLTINRNTSIGSITTSANILPVQINDNTMLTLYGAEAELISEGFDADANTYTGLGPVTLNGQNAGLNIKQVNLGTITIANNIDSITDDQGILNLEGNINISGFIGSNQSLNKINFSSSDTTINLQSMVSATTLDIMGNNNIISTMGIVIGNLIYNGQDLGEAKFRSP